MRIRHFLIPALAGILLLSACYTQIENDLNILERRIEKLEQRCREMNTTLDGLHKIVQKLESYDFLTKVDPIFSGGGIVGYTLYFTHSDPIRLYNGTDAGTPVLGVSKGTDGVWYWTVQYPDQSKPVFLTDNYGNRISTATASPMIRIENGYWMVSYDEGEIWHNLGKATGDDGASFFESIRDMGTHYEFNLLNGTTISLPTWDNFQQVLEICRQSNQNLESFKQLVAATAKRVYVHDMTDIVIGDQVIGCRLYGESREWILDENGDKIRADAPESLSVKLSVQRDGDDPLYYWAVSYGDGEPQFLLVNGAKVPASQEVPQPVVTGLVDIDNETVSIRLAGGEEILLPLEHALQVNLLAPVNNQVLEMAASDTVSFVCRLVGGDERAEVLPIAADEFFATARTTNHVDWTIRVISPATFAEGATSKLNLLVSNGYGTMKTAIVTIRYKKKK